MKMKAFFAFCVFCIPFFAVAQETTLLSADSINNYKYEYVPADDNYDFIQDRLSCLEQTIPLTYNNKVHSFVTHFVSRDREFAKKIIRRKEFFLPSI